MKRLGLALGAAALVLTLQAGLFQGAEEAKKPAAAPAKPGAEEKRADIDLVLCLDTSNSMDGLIEAAKQKLWDIVNTLARAKPMPNLRVALYSYGNTHYDKERGWVKKELDFTTNLDTVFEKIFALRTDGGEEYVTRVCRDAIQEQAWSKNAQALKMIFVCGNEAASQDPLVSLKAAAELAMKHGIAINTIYCGGSDDADCRTWRELAGLAKGQFASINQAQQVAINTPYDKELAKLADAVNKTYVPFGGSGPAAFRNQALQTTNSAGLGASNLAARVTTQASVVYRNSDWDLVDKLMEDKKFDLAKVPVEQLPEAMRKMTPAERLAYVEDMQKKRRAIQNQVNELSRQRNEYLGREMKKLAPAAKNERFDAAIQETIRKQAGEKKIDIPPE